MPKKSNVIQVLLEQGADVNIAGKDGWTPLHHAIKSRNTLAVLTLLQYPSLDPNEKRDSDVGGDMGINLYCLLLALVI